MGERQKQHYANAAEKRLNYSRLSSRMQLIFVYKRRYLSDVSCFEDCVHKYQGSTKIAYKFYSAMNGRVLTENSPGLMRTQHRRREIKKESSREMSRTRAKIVNVIQYCIYWVKLHPIM